MPTSFVLQLDTTGPAGVTVSADAGVQFTLDRVVDLTIATSDATTAGYQLKVWGDVDAAADPDVAATEPASNWISYATAKAITVSTGDGVKTINVRLRDDVGNESGVATDTITLDTTAPVTSVLTGPAPARISKVAGFRTSTITWTTDADLVAYELRVVANASDSRNAGALIASANGSSNVSGGAVAAAAQITTTIDGRDLEAASPGDGNKRIKIFGQDAAGNWTTVG